MTEKRGSWYLLTGVIIGLLVGIVLSKWIIPVAYVNTDPSSLREKDRAAYRSLVAQAFLAEGDANRALARLALLQDEHSSEVIVAQAQNLLAEGGSESAARALALLAAVVSQPSLSITALPPMTPIAVQISEAPATTDVVATESTQSTGQNTNTPGPTSTPRATPTPLATVGSPYALDGEPAAVCDPLPSTPELQITVLDAAGRAVAGVKIEISQAGGGVETFYTGLFPEISRGYADYEMVPGLNYTLRVGESGQPVANLLLPPAREATPTGI